jgi:hypothetical protein
MSAPVVLFGSIVGPHDQGDSTANGGYKSHSLMVKLLRGMGVEAYRVTRDGTQLPWLIEPPPVISLATARAWVAEGRDVRGVTTWMAAREFMDAMPRVYFYDQELAFTSREHFEDLKRRLPTLAGLATHSRTIQAWYMTMFGVTPVYIPEWSDPAYFKPAPELREQGLVGYMNEGPHTAGTVQQIQQAVHAAGQAAGFVEIGGDEASVIAQMQRCDLFLGLNPGKHDLWGEGCPRSANEAQHTGCVLISYMCHGNREYITDGYTGFLVPNGNPILMAERLIQVMRDADLKEWIRQRSLDFATHAFSARGRYELIKEFLDL